jgi:hemin uptake protein HemP
MARLLFENDYRLHLASLGPKNANRSQSQFGRAMSQDPISEPRKQDDPGRAIRVVSSRELLGCERELVIVHGPDRYRLLLTRSNKLILTK